MIHGIVVRNTDPKACYFAWPSVTVTQSGTVAAVCSGLRRRHIDPWGKTVLCLSRDGGLNFEAPRVINDSPLDDRDAGIICLGGESLLVTWFSVDVTQYDQWIKNALPPEEYEEARAVMDANSPDTIRANRGSWILLSPDGGESWEGPIRCPVNTPHGPIALPGGRLFYLGKGFSQDQGEVSGQIMSYESLDGGRTWQYLGTVPETEAAPVKAMHEPHAAAWPDGFVLGVIRVQAKDGETTYLTRSRDGGRTWTPPEDCPLGGYPTHLCVHSSGALVATYGWRHAPYGQRARVSFDRGETWSREIVLRQDGSSGDLGYPCTVELPGGSLYTVYYQAVPGETPTSIQYTRWTLDEFKSLF